MSRRRSSTDRDRPGLVEAFADEDRRDLGIGHNTLLAYLGDRLGLWRALAAPRHTSEELAQRTGYAERYVREWLAAQAAAGYLTYDPATRRSRCRPSTPWCSPTRTARRSWPPASRSSPPSGRPSTAGERLRHRRGPRLARARLAPVRRRRPVLPPAVPQPAGRGVAARGDGLVERLESGIRVLDVGCGLGSATIPMAEAFPASTFVGVDYHEESIRRAGSAANGAGVADRVTFEVAEAQGYEGSYDLICMFDTLHDLGDPVGSLATPTPTCPTTAGSSPWSQCRRPPRGQPAPAGTDLVRLRPQPLRAPRALAGWSRAGQPSGPGAHPARAHRRRVRAGPRRSPRRRSPPGVAARA